ncbi:universal stress protein [Thermoanaerobacterium thermosaccharolyticum]|jgi:K+-sensing histidine kinase KdpD|uniref:universal stress protein n=1 Tax=Thermoanaerobacterium thermosaccharolyticum TaxID=1517 RepID=UPI0010448D91|nr:universal stress protein [Thermoanaerobacterium thermosaccharolyticum]TCW35704.1 universal stress protein family protein [Thermohydrogenium kirishiense]KAA5805937.1 universal stress protein UspA [Thermoanaerobacterium thermosaccharolyticum]MBE0069626.1 universal stress protein UspA [Thermoanaerobacterium thermosaccharolyticum]MBE0229306.1 universal stress protein UspA [Thermoanaerobacterium thermosaccharolyticum]MCP2240224.1 K+-sensing histidine kinase KdpD [Thermoanaerobacterium thermosacc
MVLSYEPGVKSRIMVCVTPQKSCRRLVERGAERAKETNGEFCVVYVNKNNDIYKDLKEHKILVELFEMAQKLGGRVSILVGRKISDTLAEFADENDITEIIVGKSLRSAFEVLLHGDVINPLIKRVEEKNIIVEVIE